MNAQVVSGLGAQTDPGIVIGPTFTGFLDRVAPSGASESLKENSTSILQSCAVRSDEQSRSTGLVVGRVQSGKTLSYEGVIALARDNGFALVVVISGISNPLLEQGIRRLRHDLTLADEQGWTFLINPSASPQDEASLRSISENWGDPTTPSQLRKTGLCFLLKHHGRIDRFTDLCQRVGWAGQKVLIIDDEADQASLNVSFRRGRESATYRNIRQLRDTFPQHAYLQYTATPQAPLLLAISDTLSPDFVKVIEPGPAYVGGVDYFGAPNSLVKLIPERDLELASDPDGQPPISLTTALREFVLGAASVLASGHPETRSMLVHPSRLTASHATFVRWIRAILDFWQGAIEDPDDNAALRSTFEESWRSLSETSMSIADFDTCWSYIRFVLRNMPLVEMNARDQSGTPVIEWDATKAYVLVGGQALDRGFTVDGLSVTYMSRDPGSWTADTIQQRARFFGYKRDYIGQCRVYLEPRLRDAFEMYVAHEIHMLESLRAIQAGEWSLKGWEREFLLDPAMRATRQSVVSLPTISVSPGERWIVDTRSPDPGADAGPQLAHILDQVGEVQWNRDGYGHDHADVALSTVLRVLDDYQPAQQPVLPQFRALKLQIAKLLDDDPAAEAEVIRMRADGVDSVRTLTSAGAIQPFQGRSATRPADRDVRSASRLTMQIHFFAVRQTRDEEPFGTALTLAFWTPDDLASSWLVEDESA